jgi:hypothetical protein
MIWLDKVLHELAATTQWGYHRAQPSAAEPAALAAMALQAAGLPDAASRPMAWLNEHQAADGSIGVTAMQPSPGWPTALAISAWQQAGVHDDRVRLGIDWLLSVHGKPLDRDEIMGHDTTLIGWPWVAGTHSWLEPTAFAVAALKATGHTDHPRTREAVRLIIDRLLPDGGANYGNTVVLDQQLRPHVQPSGIVLLAVADESDPTGRINRTVEYLRSVLSAETTTASLCFALMGLAASRQLPEQQLAWLERASERTLARDTSPYKLALLALAANIGRLFAI